jgi:hypothetical protein
MKSIIYILTFAAALFAAQNSFSQKKLDVKNEIKLDKTFQISGKSRTVMMKKGDTYHITLDLKKDKAYYISVSGNKSLSDIQYKLVSEDGNSNVLYDNSAYEFNNQTIVRVKEDSKVVLEIKTQPANYLAYSAIKKDVKLLIASKKVKSSNMNDLPNMIVLASNN